MNLSAERNNVRRAWSGQLHLLRLSTTYSDESDHFAARNDGRLPRCADYAHSGLFMNASGSIRFCHVVPFYFLQALKEEKAHPLQQEQALLGISQWGLFTLSRPKPRWRRWLKQHDVLEDTST
jgi:hypothetical protein